MDKEADANVLFFFIIFLHSNPIFWPLARPRI